MIKKKKRKWCITNFLTGQAESASEGNKRFLHSLHGHQLPVKHDRVDSFSSTSCSLYHRGAAVFCCTYEVQDPAHRAVAPAGQNSEIWNITEEVQPANNKTQRQQFNINN